MLSEHRGKHAARSFLRRLIDSARRKPLRTTTDKHPAYTKAIRWIVGRKALHRRNQHFDNRVEQDHRSIKHRYYPILGFAKVESASRSCNAFDELRN
ncbi:MAG: DDE-type integrase/transposase/recombinase [Dehalococcoidia bacterium]|nr:DDE-type integrase/transposase/recombinase [Dehalococcoidia bacterium]